MLFRYTIVVRGPCTPAKAHDTRSVKESYCSQKVVNEKRARGRQRRAIKMRVKRRRPVQLETRNKPNRPNPIYPSLICNKDINSSMVVRNALPKYFVIPKIVAFRPQSESTSLWESTPDALLFPSCPKDLEEKAETCRLFEVVVSSIHSFLRAGH